MPRRADFSVDVPAVIAAAKKHKPKMLFLTAPNNPDGCGMSDDDVRACLDLPLLVVLDEAYIEFSRQQSRIKWVQERENLVVLRTFSKRAGLAGLRVGYGAFPLSLIEFLWRAKQPYNVSVAAEVAACAALSNRAYLQKVKDALVAERERLFKVLQGLPGIQPYPSEANFILCKVVGHDAAKVKDRLMREEGIMVRVLWTRRLRLPAPRLCCSARTRFGSSVAAAETSARPLIRRARWSHSDSAAARAPAPRPGEVLQQAGGAGGVH